MTANDNKFLLKLKLVFWKTILGTIATVWVIFETFLNFLLTSQKPKNGKITTSIQTTDLPENPSGSNVI